MKARQIFERLWKDYTTQNPEALHVYESFTSMGETVLNDHIAFRTFNHPRTNVDVLARPFLLAGYEQKGYYIFEDKHLAAKHYEIPGDPLAPRVFISQLMLENFSSNLQSVVNECIARIPDENVFGNELIFGGNLWEPISYDTYSKLREESEYAAWMYVFGFCANHFTVSINSLKQLNTIEKVNSFLKEKGFTLNAAGGEIKGTPAELLEQSSTKAGLIHVRFSDGTFEVPSCYYEFARRYPDDNGKIYSGFIAKSADKIFESTDFYKK